MSKAHKITHAKNRAHGRETRRRESQHQEKAARRESLRVTRLVRTKPA